jgi:hypothetical protein
MGKEQNKNDQQISYEQLRDVAAQLQQRNNDLESQLRQMNEIREMAYMCIQLLEHKDAMPPLMLNKVINFLDRLIPVPKDNTEEEK